jgi:hypothetical protein
LFRPGKYFGDCAKRLREPEAHQRHMPPTDAS